jgi:ABC-2 type transport system ATP-binding protein
LLDEPTSGLDPSAAADFSRIVKRAASSGTAILMATHDLYRIREMADRIGILSNGRMGQEVDPKSLDHVELEELYIRTLGA